MDPFASGLISKSPYGSKRIIRASVVAILQLNMDNRGLTLINPQSRALKKNEIHELIVTDEKDARPGTIVNNASYVAFIEIKNGGVMVVGDEVYCNKIFLGTVAGFDDTHMPNHQNIVLYSPKRITGKELNISLEDPVIINAKKRIKNMRMTGSWVAIPTPFKKDGKVDLEGFKPIIDFQKNYGTNGLLVLGSAGESSMLSSEEKQEIIRYVVEYCQNRIPLFVGTTGSNTEDTIQMTRYAKMVGADGVLMVMPSYIKPPQEDLFNFLNTVAEQVDIPIAVYNNPSRVGVNIKPETAIKMINIKNIIAFKEAMPDVSQLIKVQIGMKRKVDVLTCDAPPYSIMLPNLALGGSGTTSITGNLIPEEFAQLSRPWEKYEDMLNSRNLVFKYFPLMEVCYSVTNPVVIKAGLNLLGLPGGNPRLPLRQLEGEKLLQLNNIMETLGVIKKYKV